MVRVKSVMDRRTEANGESYVSDGRKDRGKW
jgi:hypothetical protein